MEEAAWCELLRTGSLEVVGRMPWSSNATFLLEVRCEEVQGRAIYKPARGEQPLWDFPEGIFRREVAAYELSQALDLGIVPATVVREDAPYGEGSLQRFIDADYEQHYFTLIEDPSHEAELRLIAAFDVVVNNADRKGGHLLIDDVGHIWGIDHGLCFHADPKLRTVMWDFAGEPIPDAARAFATRLLEQGVEELAGLIDEEEMDALLFRAELLLEEGTYPLPPARRSHPWPLV